MLSGYESLISDMTEVACKNLVIGSRCLIPDNKLRFGPCHLLGRDHPLSDSSTHQRRHLSVSVSASHSHCSVRWIFTAPSVSSFPSSNSNSNPTPPHAHIQTFKTYFPIPSTDAQAQFEVSHNWKDSNSQQKQNSRTGTLPFL